MSIDMVSEKTIGKMVALRENNPKVREYIALEKQLPKDKKVDSETLVKMRELGEIASNSKFIEGFASVYFRETDFVVGDCINNKQILAIAKAYPDLIRSVLTADLLKKAVESASGGRSEEAKAIQSINLNKAVKTKYTAVIGEA